MYRAKTFALVQVFQNVCDSNTLVPLKYAGFNSYMPDLQLQIPSGIHTIEHDLEVGQKLCDHLPTCRC